MNEAFAAYTADRLRGMSAQDADRALCAMHSEDWHAIASAIGIRLPTFGGDKPALILAALRPTGAQ